MKKYGIVCVVILSLFTAGTYAEQISSLNLGIGGENFTMKYSSSSDVQYSVFMPFMLEGNSTWFTSGPVLGPLKLGFDFSFGMGLSGGPKMDGTKQDDWFYIDEMLGIGLAFLYDIDEVSLIKFTPGLKFNMEEGFYTASGYSGTKEYNLYLALSFINIAYQRYFSKNFGLNLGFDADIPLVGFWFKNVYYASKYMGGDDGGIGAGFNYRFFVGLAIR